MNSKKKSIRPGSNKDAFCRGLSQSEYNIAMRMIRDGLVTEKELIDAGKMLPAGPVGRPRSDAYNWFLEVTQS